MSSASEYSDSGEDFSPSLSRRGKRGAEHAYKIKHALKPPRTTTYTAQSLYDQVLQGNIDLSPDYQRDVVWNEQKQVNLVDSIFRNFYIPPLIFAVVTADDGTEKRTCIDGKQRLTSIQKFIDGLICHRDPDHPRDKYWYTEKDWYTDKRTTGYPLPKKYKNLFANKQIVCIEYHDLSDEDEREIFRRVQLGMALTVAEKMKAETRTEKSVLVHDLVTAYGGQLADVGFASKRDNPFRWTATALLTLTLGNPVQQTVSYDQCARWLKDTTPLPEGFEDRVRSAFKLLMSIITDRKKDALQLVKGVKTVAPIDFVFMVVLVYTFMGRFDADHLATAIRKMRQLAREEQDDLRWNPNVMPPYCRFLANLETQGLELLDEEDTMEVDELTMEYSPPPQPAPSSSSTAPRRSTPKSGTAATPSSNPPLPPPPPPPSTLTLSTALAPAPMQAQASGTSRLAAIKSAKAGTPVSSSQTSPPPQSQAPVSYQPPTPTSATLSHPLPARPSFSGLSNVVTASGVTGPTRASPSSRDDRFRPYPPPGEAKKAKNG